MQNWDYVLKFIICGDAGVGKSSLLIRLTDQRFLTNSEPTLGVEFGSKLLDVPIDGGKEKKVKLQCWDTAGTESFRSITRSYYRGAAGCLLVYDVTSRASFMNARAWLSDVREHADPHLSCILVANKIDLCEPADNSGSVRSGKTREVTVEEGEQWAKDEGLLFVEASAKSGQNVELAFVTASRDILDKVERGLFNQGKSPGVKPSNANNNNTLALQTPAVKQGCC